MASLAAKTIAGSLAALIKEDILSGAYPPGETLRQEVLATRYDVSRIPVREALLQLQAQGVVDVHPHRGVVVRPMSLEEATDVFQLRLKIEPDLIACAAGQATPATWEAVRQLSEAMNEELTRNGPNALFSDLHARFHRMLYACEGRPRSVEIVDRLYTLSERYIRQHLYEGHRNTRSRREHDAVLTAFLKGDGDAAAAAARKHIQGTLDDLGAALARQGG